MKDDGNTLYHLQNYLLLPGISSVSRLRVSNIPRPNLESVE